MSYSEAFKSISISRNERISFVTKEEKKFCGVVSLIFLTTIIARERERGGERGRER
jgi:hypothetical protein